MIELITISKANLKDALMKIGSQDWLGHPKNKRLTLARYYFPDIDSGLELESCSDDEDAINQFWEALKNG